MKSTKFWVISIAVFMLLSVISAAAVFFFYGSGNTASIYHNGQLIDTIHLDTVTTPYSFIVHSENHHYNVITVEKGRICVSEASCPDHVCVNTGWISDGAIPIVCLPNELVIQIEADSSNQVDAAVQ